MKDFLVRLLILAPLTIILVLSCLTVIIPFLFWAATGKSYPNQYMKFIEYIKDTFDL